MDGNRLAVRRDASHTWEDNKMDCCDMGNCHGAVKKGKGKANLGVVGHGKGMGTKMSGMGRKEGLVQSGVKIISGMKKMGKMGKMGGVKKY